MCDSTNKASVTMNMIQYFILYPLLDGLARTMTSPIRHTISPDRSMARFSVCTWFPS